MNIKATYAALGLSVVAMVLSATAMMHSYLGVNGIFIRLSPPTYSSGLVYELTGMAIFDVAVFVASIFMVKDSFLDVSMAIYVHEEILARMRRVLSFMGAAFASASIIMILIAVASVI